MSTSEDIRSSIPAPRSSPENGDGGEDRRGDGNGPESGSRHGGGGEDRPESGVGRGAGSEDGTGDGAPAPRRRRRRLLPALLAVALLLGGAALHVRTQQLAGTPAAGNRALADTEATSRVAGEVSGALSRVFSYTPQGTAATRQAADRLLAGKAAQQYETLFGQVEQRAAEQGLTLTTHVVRAGVTRLTDRTAHLLVFLDQVAQREGKPPTTVAAQLSVTAELRDGRWQITDITSR